MLRRRCRRLLALAPILLWLSWLLGLGAGCQVLEDAVSGVLREGSGSPSSPNTGESPSERSARRRRPRPPAALPGGGSSSRDQAREDRDKASGATAPAGRGDSVVVVGRLVPRAGIAEDPERLRELERTLSLIAAGGPYPHRQDGVVFGNREGRLPKQPPGYYHEYTVRTPGAPTRGARRVITGEGGECYYSDDHYQTFTPLPRAGGRP